MSIILMLMWHAKRLRKTPSIPIRCVPSSLFLQHECTLASGTSAARSRQELTSVCLYESTWSPLLCRLHSAVPQCQSFLWLVSIWDPCVSKIIMVLPWRQQAVYILHLIRHMCGNTPVHRKSQNGSATEKRLILQFLTSVGNHRIKHK